MSYVCSSSNPSEYIGPEQLAPHAKRKDAMHDLGDGEADQVCVGHWALYVLSIGLVLTGIAMVVLGWFY
jgi:cytochrome b561